MTEDESIAVTKPAQGDGATTESTAGVIEHAQDHATAGSKAAMTQHTRGAGSTVEVTEHAQGFMQQLDQKQQ